MVKKEMLIISDKGECHYYSDFIKSQEKLYPILREKINWRSDDISLFGKTHPIPRLHAWYGDEGAEYRYSKIQLPRNEWTPELLKLKNQVENFTGLKFNSVLCNFYRDGSDSNGWHSDDESELVKPVNIASLSFGDARTMQFRPKGESKVKVSLELESGSLVVMKNPHQENWQHQIPKRAGRSGRINLTFRLVKVISS